MIRNLTAALLAALLCCAGRAWAQNEMEGLDLTGEQPATEPKTEPAEVKPSAPVRTATDDVAVEKVKRTDEPAVEHDTTQDDRVKAVQRKLYLKRGRVELAPYFVVNVNDAYYAKVGGAVRLAVYPADSLAISARFTLMQTLPTDDATTAKRTLYSRLFFSAPIWSAIGDIEWSPLYGKVAFANSILQFDGYLIGGAGVVSAETSARTVEDPTQASGRRQVGTVYPAFDLGIGLRFIAKDWLAVNVALINTTYVDTPTGTTKGATQNLMLVNVGLSIFLPFKSTYRDEQ